MDKQTLFLVIRCVEFEGYQLPLGIFSTQELAESSIKQWKKENPKRGDSPYVHEMELDEYKSDEQY